MRRIPVLVAVVAATVAATFAGIGTEAAQAQTPNPTTAPTLHVAPIVSGLDHPWDLAFAPDGAMFFTERDKGRLWVRPPNDTPRVLNADMSDLWVSLETGLMSVEVDPAFASNRRIYTCQGTTDDNFTVQVVAWVVDANYTTATRVADPLVGDIDGSAGRHGGCQLRFDNSGALFIGTGDAATGPYPQDPHSLNGKTLRVDRFTGAGLPGNPFFNDPAAGDPRIQTIGHRNVQGVAREPANGQMWSVEQGTDRDDEINKLVNGANYGWDPNTNGTYDESQPMTDLTKFPHAIPAAWSSGFPTLATSAGTFLSGPDWGSWNGALAVTALKDSQLLVFGVSDAGTGTASLIATPSELNGTFGRLRGDELGPDGILYLTTDNGNSTDQIIAVSPRIDQRGPAVASSAAGRIDQVARGFDDAVWERHGTGVFSSWTSLGGITTSDPDIAAWPTGHVDVVVRGRDGSVWDDVGNNGTFSGWQSLGGIVTSGPTAVSWGPGRTDVFARGTDGRMWHLAWNGTAWQTWEGLQNGQVVGGAGAVSVQPNQVDVFARGLDSAIWVDSWRGTAWTGWQQRGGLTTASPDADSTSPGTEDIFVRGLDGAQWRANWNGTTYSGFQRLG